MKLQFSLLLMKQFVTVSYRYQKHVSPPFEGVPVLKCLILMVGSVVKTPTFIMVTLWGPL